MAFNQKGKRDHSVPAPPGIGRQYGYLGNPNAIYLDGFSLGPEHIGIVNTGAQMSMMNPSNKTTSGGAVNDLRKIFLEQLGYDIQTLQAQSEAKKAQEAEEAKDFCESLFSKL